MRKIKFTKIAIVLGVMFMLFSCSSSLGYGVILWHDDAHGIKEGTIVKVYIKSNISQVYVISLPDSKEKIEIPLWQMTEPQSRSGAEKTAQRFSEYVHTYASVKLDGLPIREEPVNTARQVYRLRKDEIIRVLYKGKGQPVGNLEGDWLRVLTEGGTLGWCFSYNLNLFDRSKISDIAAVSSTDETKETDEYLESLRKKSWYPEYYDSMIKSGRIDLNRMNVEYGFSFGVESFTKKSEENERTQSAPLMLGDTPSSESQNSSVGTEISQNGQQTQSEGALPENGTATMKLSDISLSWDYSSITKNSTYEYKLEGTNVTFTCRDGKNLSLRYMGTDGKVYSENFTALEENIQELIDTEYERRQTELRTLAESGPVFRSSNYGTIRFNNENSVTWSGFRLLVPSIISRSATSNVTVSVEYFIANSLKSEFDGILTFHFNGMQEPVNFFYKMVDDGLRLEDATNAVIRNNIAVSRGSSPLVMFFSKN